MSKYEQVYLRDGYRCRYCGRWLLADFDSWASLHTDHLVPRSKGGEDDKDNLVTSCPTCNMLKGGWSPPDISYEKSPKKFLQACRAKIANRRAEWTLEFLDAVEDWKKGGNQSV